MLPSHRPRSRAAYLALATFAAGCTGVVSSDSTGGGCTGLVSGSAEGGGSGSVPEGRTESGIPLNPTDGTGTRALQCEADHAPLRRLSHAEYANTLADLFGDIAIPEIQVAPDARRGGFTNNYEALAPSTLLITQYHENAQLVAAATAPSLIGQLGCGQDEACFRQFVTDFGRRAYRRPLLVEEVDTYVEFFAIAPAAGDFTMAVEMAIATMLQSPDFVYRPEFGGSDGKLAPFEIASRLSYFLWASMPDDTLLDAAEAGRLNGAGLAAEVDRMLTDEKARDGLLFATGEWLELDRLESTLKSAEYAFTPAVRASLRESFERFLWDRVFSEGGSLEELLTSNGAYVNSTIGPIFGINDAGPDMAWREFGDRHGFLTHPAILATHGYGTYPSPVRRGVFLLTEVFCDPPTPPPPGIPFGEPPTESASGAPLSNREGYEELTQSQPACAACHDRINPFGYAFEHYDTDGSYRDIDSGAAIDSSGTSQGFTMEEPFEFGGAQELATQMGESRRVRACFVDRWVRYASGGGSIAFDPCLRAELEEVAVRPGTSLRDVVLAIAVHPKFAAAEVVE